MTEQNHRKIRSFVRREGRLTVAQTRAIEVLLPELGLTNQKALYDFKTIFGNDNPVALEIGFGMGYSLVEMAVADPNQNFVGIEVHSPGIGTILNEIEKAGVTNVRVIQDDAIEILDDCIADESLSRINIYFPDPWHKARHNKRRIIQPDFLTKISQKLKADGKLHLATDWENYAEQMMEVLTASPEFKNAYDENKFAPDRLDRPETKFERRGLKLGHGVWDLWFLKSTKT